MAINTVTVILVDAVMLQDLQSAMIALRDPIKQGFVDFIQYNRDALENLKLVRFDKKSPGHAFWCTSRVLMLLVGNGIQQSNRIAELESKLAESHPSLWNRALGFGKRLLRRLK